MQDIIGFGYFCSTTTVAPFGTPQARAWLPGRNLATLIPTNHSIEENVVLGHVGKKFGSITEHFIGL
jgi:hypothetical protein